MVLQVSERLELLSLGNNFWTLIFFFVCLFSVVIEVSWRVEWFLSQFDFI